eukprot:s2569_g5.t1
MEQEMGELKEQAPEAETAEAPAAHSGVVILKLCLDPWYQIHPAHPMNPPELSPGTKVFSLLNVLLAFALRLASELTSKRQELDSELAEVSRLEALRDELKRVTCSKP